MRGEGMTKKAWRRYSHKTGKCIQTARIHLLGIGKYAFETSLFGNPWELNINMPMFRHKKKMRSTGFKRQGNGGRVRKKQNRPDRVQSGPGMGGQNGPERG